MLAGERRIEILHLLTTTNFISVKELSEQFSTHETTIRRDLEILENEGKVSRVHGGVAPLVLRHSEPLFEVRRTERLKEKERIGQFAASLIKDGETIILDSGTTTLQIAMAMQSFEHLKAVTVITNDIQIATVLSGIRWVKVIVTGGILYPDSFMLNGRMADRVLKEVNVDTVFLATPALHPQIGLTHFDEVLATTKILMADAATQKIVVTDCTKVGQKSLITVLQPQLIDLLIVDEALSTEMKRSLMNGGIKQIKTV